MPWNVSFCVQQKKEYHMTLEPYADAELLFMTELLFYKRKP